MTRANQRNWSRWLDRRHCWHWPIILSLLLGAPLAVATTPARIFIEEYQIKGARLLPQIEIERAVYPYLGPARSPDDVEQARAALEQAYHSRGYQTVSVQIPPQPWQDGVIELEVVEAPVGRLRVHGARYFLPSAIRATAPSMSETRVPDFREVNRDVLALNQHPDLRVTPVLKAGQMPGTVDIDLQVEDKLPLHARLELNNRSSPNTTDLRLDGALSYHNLWQRGHTVGASFQLSPQDTSEVRVFSAFYELRLPAANAWTLRVHGTKQDSEVSTLGGVVAGGRGIIAGAQAVVPLPTTKELSHMLILGVNYRRTDQDVTLASGHEPISTSCHYFPFNVLYSALWLAGGGQTELTIGPTFSFRGLGSDPADFASARTGADGNFIYLHGSAAHTRPLPGGLELYGLIQGQIASKPLLSTEQFGGGGLGTIRGYREGEVFGDNGVCGRLELRSPALVATRLRTGEWRLYVFAEAGRWYVLEPLPEQTARFDLASYGCGSRLQLSNHFYGSLDLGVPLISQSTTRANNLFLTFRVWTEL